MFKLTIKNSAKKELDAISNDQFLKIDAAILALKTNPHPYPQSKKLKGKIIADCVLAITGSFMRSMIRKNNHCISCAS